MPTSPAQFLLKLAWPGVPDFYQGTELWDFSLVEPDNRRPVDFELRQKLLDELRGSSLTPAQLARELYGSWDDGRIKLFLTHAGLAARRAAPDLFGEGSYLPLKPEGPRAPQLAAVARLIGPRLAVGAVPRAQDEDGLHRGGGLRAGPARLVHQERGGRAAEIEVEQEARRAQGERERLGEMPCPRELELRAEEAPEALGVLVPVLADDELHAGGAGKQAPTACFHRGSSSRTARCPCHSRVRSRTIGRPRPLP